MIEALDLDIRVTGCSSQDPLFLFLSIQSAVKDDGMAMHFNHDAVWALLLCVYIMDCRLGNLYTFHSPRCSEAFCQALINHRVYFCHPWLKLVSLASLADKITAFNVLGSTSYQLPSTPSVPPINRSASSSAYERLLTSIRPALRSLLTEAPLLIPIIAYCPWWPLVRVCLNLILPISSWLFDRYKSLHGSLKVYSHHRLSKP